MANLLYVGNHERETRYVSLACSQKLFQSIIISHHILIADTMKGSYYANPVIDEPNVPQELREAYPEYYRKNICRDPHRAIEE